MENQARVFVLVWGQYTSCGNHPWWQAAVFLGEEEARTAYREREREVSDQPRYVPYVRLYRLLEGVPFGGWEGNPPDLLGKCAEVIQENQEWSLEGYSEMKCVND